MLAVGAISETQLQGDEVDIENMFQVCFVLVLPVPRETIPQGQAEEEGGGVISQGFLKKDQDRQ